MFDREITELVTKNNHEPLTHLGFCLLRCCVIKATSSCLSTCICDRESSSSKLSSSVILHQERTDKVFGSDLYDCSIRFSKFIITTRLPIRRSCAEPCRIHRELCQSVHSLQESTATQEDTHVLNS
jgi:hypothetical protein